jgi:hypothetical protein
MKLYKRLTRKSQTLREKRAESGRSLKETAELADEKGRVWIFFGSSDQFSALAW